MVFPVASDTDYELNLDLGGEIVSENTKCCVLLDKITIIFDKKIKDYAW